MRRYLNQQDSSGIPLHLLSTFLRAYVPIAPLKQRIPRPHVPTLIAHAEAALETWCCHSRKHPP